MTHAFEVWIGQTKKQVIYVTSSTNPWKVAKRTAALLYKTPHVGIKEIHHG